MARRRGHRLPPRNAKGRFTKRYAANPGRRKSRRVRVHTGKFGRKIRKVRVAKHPVLVNRRRRRRSYSSNPRRRYAYVSNRRRRGYRRNPGLKSIFSAPTLKQVGYAVVGIAGTPMLVGFLNRYLPASMTGNKYANYAIKAGAAWGLSLIADKVAGKDASRAVLIGGLAYVAIGAISDFFPSLLTMGSGSTAVGTGRYLNAQPLLAGAGTYPFRGTAGPITAGSPSRLDPASRF